MRLHPLARGCGLKRRYFIRVIQVWAFSPLCAKPKITVGGRSNARITGRKSPGVCRVTFDDVGLHNLFHARHRRRAGGGQRCRCKRRKAFHYLVPELSLIVRWGAGFSGCELMGHKRAWQALNTPARCQQQPQPGVLLGRFFQCLVKPLAVC